MENLIAEIKKTQKELDNPDIDFDYETELLEKLPGLTARKAQKAIQEINESLIEKLSPKQKSFYVDIHAFLKNWVNERIENFLTLSYDEQLSVGKEGVKITIKRIEELLTDNLDGKTFSVLVDEFSYIRSGGIHEPGGKHDHLRNDFN